MRIPLAVNLESRDGGVTKDAKVVNGICEVKGKESSVRSRPGVTNLGAMKTGTAQCLAAFSTQIIGVIAGFGNRGTISSLTYTQAASTNLSISTSAQVYAASNTSSTAPFILFVDRTLGRYYDGGFTMNGLASPACTWFALSKTLVPGVAFLNGYWFVMDTDSVIWNSNLDDVVNWGALNFITANQESGRAVALAKSGYYIVALKEYSTEPFFDNANSTGSPLSPVEGASTQIGCASGFSVAELDGNLFWISQSKQKGRGVHMMAGMDQQKISTPDVDRILDDDDLATVYALGAKVDGHRLYILSLVTSNITLVFDIDSQLWDQWSSYDLGASVSISSITRSGSTATVVTSAPHNITDGEPAGITGATQTEYNGTFQASYISPTSYSIQVTGTPASPATGSPVSFPYTETYFKFIKYANFQNRDLFLHVSLGQLYQMRSVDYLDSGGPIGFLVRTTRLDGGTSEIKAMSRATLIGDRASDSVMMRYSDDDCTTYSAYRLINLSDEEPMIRRLGAFKRRTMEIKHVTNGPVQLDALELEIS